MDRISPPTSSPEFEEQFLPPEPEPEYEYEEILEPTIPSAYFENPDFLVLNRYRPISLIGTGGYSATYLAEDTYADPPRKVAIKRMANKELNTAAIAEFKHYSFLQSSEPPPKHIVTAHERFFSENGIANIVMEALDAARPVEIPPCSCSSSHTHLTCPQRELRFLKIAKQLLLGLYSLHQHAYIHGDVKPANVLYALGTNTLKLIDLGNTLEPEKQSSVEEDYEFQTREYRAPEILLGAGPVSDRCDIWAAGIVLLEWFLGPKGRQELAEYRASKALAGERIAILRENHDEPLMTCPGDATREAMVDRMISLFGSVKSYSNGAFYDHMYEEMSEIRQRKKTDKDYSVIRERTGIIRDFLRERCNEGLATFFDGMLAINARDRWTAVDALRNPWLVDTLYGEHAFILDIPYSSTYRQPIQPHHEEEEDIPHEEDDLRTPVIKQSHSPPSWVASASAGNSANVSRRESGRSSPVARMIEGHRVVETPVRGKRVGRPIVMPSSATTARTDVGTLLSTILDSATSFYLENILLG